MNAMRLLAVGAIVCLLGASAAADDKKPDFAKLIVGKWEVSKADENTVNVGAVAELDKDGKLKFTGKEGGQDVNIDGKYKVAGDKFSVTFTQNGEEKTHEMTIAKLDDTTLHVVDKDGKKVEFTRKK